MVGIVSRKNVITLTGDAPGPCRSHTSTEPHRHGLSPNPTDAYRAFPEVGPPCQAPRTARPTLLLVQAPGEVLTVGGGGQQDHQDPRNHSTYGWTPPCKGES